MSRKPLVIAGDETAGRFAPAEESPPPSFRRLDPKILRRLGEVRGLTATASDALDELEYALAVPASLLVPSAHVERPAVGYAFTYKGRKLVVSGDTVASPRVELEAKGADVLVHEALSPRLVGMLAQGAHDAGRSNLEAVFKDILTYHTTPEQAAAIAQRAGVGFLLLDHIVPALPYEALEGPFLGQARSIYSGPIKVGRDGDFISMPAGSKDNIVSNVMR